MAFTLAQLQAELQNHGYGSDTTTAQTAAINAAIRDINNYRRWPWDDAAISGTFVVGTSVITPPTTLIEPIAVRVQEQIGYYTDLTYLVPEDFLDLYMSDTVTRDTPEYWTYRAGSILVWPTPSAAIGYAIDYTGASATLVNGTDTVNLPDVFINPIVWGALKHLAFRERDWGSFDVADRQFLQTISRAAADIGLSGSSTRSGNSGFYDNYDGPTGII